MELHDLWSKQLSCKFPLSIPLYQGVNLPYEQIEEKYLAPAIHLMRTKLPRDLMDYIAQKLQEQKTEETELRLNKIDYRSQLTDHDCKGIISLDYDVIKGKVKLDHFAYDFISFPMPLPDQPHFLVEGSYYTIVDELIKQESFTFSEVKGPLREKILRIHFRPSVLGTEEYFGLVLYRYIDPDLPEGKSKVVELVDDKGDTIFRRSLDHLLSDGESRSIPEITEEMYAQVLPSLYQLVPPKSEDPLSYITQILDELSDPKFTQDSLALKRILSGYEVYRDLLFGGINFCFSRSYRYHRTQIMSCSYLSVCKRLFGGILKYIDSDLNPIGYLAAVREINLNGPHGPKITTIPMRDYQTSYNGVLDPIETPEGRSLGLTLHRALSASYDALGAFESTPYKDTEGCNFNFTAQEIPFIQHNDSIRCSMATHHIAQAVPLIKATLPYVSTGIDRVIYGTMYKQTTASEAGFIHYEKGKVPTLNDKPVKLVGKTLSNTKSLQDVFLRYQDTEVPAGAPLFNTSSLKDGYLCLGTEVLMAWMPYRGKNYEDSIIISQSLAERLVLSKGYKQVINLKDRFIVHDKIPALGDTVTRGQSVLDYRQYGTMTSGDKDEKKKMILSSNTFHELIQKDGMVYKINFYRDEVRVNRKSEYNQVELFIKSPHRIAVGDKISFSSAGKGIISEILPDEKMPKTKDGKTIELIYNTLGVPSRMNLSQLLEGALGMLHQLILEHRLEPLLTLRAMNSVLQLDNLTDFINFCEEHPETTESLKENFVFEVKQFDTTINFTTVQQLFSVLGLDKYFNPYTGEHLTLPEGKLTRFPVFYGYNRILCLKHIVEDKHSAISIPYFSDTKETAQKVGEMEHLALEAHGCSNFINEVALVRSGKGGYGKILRDITYTQNRDHLVNLDNYRNHNPLFEEFVTVLKGMGIVIKKVIR